MAPITAEAIANRASRIGSAQFVEEHSDLTEILLDRLENGEQMQSMRQLAVTALQVACKPLITDADYREMGQIACRMVENIAIGVCNDYPDGTRTIFDSEEHETGS